MNIDQHPNPQHRREKVTLLNGSWDFCFDDDNEGLTKGYFKNEGWGKNTPINVPYVYQSPRSGIGITDKHIVVWYKKIIELDSKVLLEQLTLHFEAVDYLATIFINGVLVGSHEGGYEPFSMAIKPYVKIGSNDIVVRVEDHNSPRQIIGKQSHVNQGVGTWYSQNTGIWQSVWLEAHNETYVKNIRFIPHLNEGEMEVLAEIAGFKAEGAKLKLDVSFSNATLNRHRHEYIYSNNRAIETTVHNNLARFRFHIHDICLQIPLWSPDTPRLFDVDIELTCEDGSKDELKSYFGYRKISIEKDRFYLNDKPYFQKLLLNQGYYGDGMLTGTDAEFIHDINMAKAMGFNGIRIHQKFESHRFIYLCDKLGLLYWAELPSPYSNDSFASEQLMKDLIALVHKHANHPCVVAWTPFNESWGIAEILHNKRHQQLTVAARAMIKALDEQQRPVIGNDGWEHTDSDIFTIHDYEQNIATIASRYPKSINDMQMHATPTNMQRALYANGFTYNGEPVILSEYGGIAYRPKKFAGDDWGYGNPAKDEEDFFTRFEAMHDIFFSLNYLSGVCYTQLTDVQQEVNGLLDHDHKPKFDIERIAAILKKRRTV